MVFQVVHSLIGAEMKTLSVAVNLTVMVGEGKYNYCGG